MKLWLAFSEAFFSNRYGKMVVSSAATRAAEPPPKAWAARGNIKRMLLISNDMWQGRELIPELQKLCPVDYVNVVPAMRVKNRVESLDLDLIEQQLGDLKDKSFDVCLVYLPSSLLSDSLLSQLRRLAFNAPLIGMNLDDKTSFENLSILPSFAKPYRVWAKEFDCNLTNSLSAVDLYHSLGFPCLYLPTGFHYDPRIHSWDESVPYRYNLTFVGSFKPARGAFINKIRRMGVQVEVFGSGWPDSQFTNDGWKIFQQSQINLGIGYNVDGQQITNLKNRDFECVGVGGCYLTTFDWELAHLFDVGKEILCYRDVYDFAELWSFYIRRPDLCREIARAGRKRAIEEHTWEKRFRKVFKELGLYCEPQTAFPS